MSLRGLFANRDAIRAEAPSAEKVSAEERPASTAPTTQKPTSPQVSTPKSVTTTPAPAELLKVVQPVIFNTQDDDDEDEDEEEEVDYEGGNDETPSQSVRMLNLQLPVPAPVTPALLIPAAFVVEDLKVPVGVKVTKVTEEESADSNEEEEEQEQEQEDEEEEQPQHQKVLDTPKENEKIAETNAQTASEEEEEEDEYEGGEESVTAMIVEIEVPVADPVVTVSAAPEIVAAEKEGQGAMDEDEETEESPVTLTVAAVTPTAVAAVSEVPEEKEEDEDEEPITVPVVVAVPAPIPRPPVPEVQAPVEVTPVAQAPPPRRKGKNTAPVKPETPPSSPPPSQPVQVNTEATEDEKMPEAISLPPPVKPEEPAATTSAPKKRVKNTKNQNLAEPVETATVTPAVVVTVVESAVEATPPVDEKKSLKKRSKMSNEIKPGDEAIANATVTSVVEDKPTPMDTTEPEKTPVAAAPAQPTVVDTPVVVTTPSKPPPPVESFKKIKAAFNKGGQAASNAVASPPPLPHQPSVVAATAVVPAAVVPEVQPKKGGPGSRKNKKNEVAAPASIPAPAAPVVQLPQAPPTPTVSEAVAGAVTASKVAKRKKEQPLPVDVKKATTTTSAVTGEQPPPAKKPKVVHDKQVVQFANLVNGKPTNETFTIAWNVMTPRREIAINTLGELSHQIPTQGLTQFLQNHNGLKTAIEYVPEASEVVANERETIKVLKVKLPRYLLPLLAFHNWNKCTQHLSAEILGKTSSKLSPEDSALNVTDSYLSMLSPLHHETRIERVIIDSTPVSDPVAGGGGGGEDEDDERVVERTNDYFIERQIVTLASRAIEVCPLNVVFPMTPIQIEALSTLLTAEFITPSPEQTPAIISTCKNMIQTLATLETIKSPAYGVVLRKLEGQFSLYMSMLSCTAPPQHAGDCGYLKNAPNENHPLLDAIRKFYFDPAYIEEMEKLGKTGVVPPAVRDRNSKAADNGHTLQMACLMLCIAKGKQSFSTGTATGTTSILSRYFAKTHTWSSKTEFLDDSVDSSDGATPQGGDDNDDSRSVASEHDATTSAAKGGASSSSSRKPASVKTHSVVQLADGVMRITIPEAGSFIAPSSTSTTRSFPGSSKKTEKVEPMAPVALATLIEDSVTKRLAKMATMRFVAPAYSAEKSKEREANAEDENVKSVVRLRMDMDWILPLFRRIMASIAKNKGAIRWVTNAWKRTVNRIVDSAFLEEPETEDPAAWFLADSNEEYEIPFDDEKISFTEAIPTYQELTTTWTKLMAAKKVNDAKDQRDAEVAMLTSEFNEMIAEFEILELMACLCMSKIANFHIDKAGKFTSK